MDILEQKCCDQHKGCEKGKHTALQKKNIYDYFSNIAQLVLSISLIISLTNIIVEYFEIFG